MSVCNRSNSAHARCSGIRPAALKIMKKHVTLLLAGTVASTITALAGGVVDDGVGLQPSGGNEGFLNTNNGSLPMLGRGTQEFGIGGSVGLDDGIEWDLTVSYGVFIADNWEVGFSVDWAGEDGDILRDSRFGLFTEYNFATGTKWVPFVGLGASYATSGDRFDPTEEDGTIDGVDGVAFTGELGIKYFFRPNIAVAASVTYNWSPDDVFGVADDIGDSLTNIEIGLRFYF